MFGTRLLGISILMAVQMAKSPHHGSDRISYRWETAGPDFNTRGAAEETEFWRKLRYRRKHAPVNFYSKWALKTYRHFCPCGNAALYHFRDKYFCKKCKPKLAAG